MNTILLALPPERVPSDANDRVRAVAPTHQLLVRSRKSEIEPVLGELEIVAGEFPPSLLSRGPQIKWFQLWYAGVDWLQKFPEIRELPVTLTNASGIHGEQMTEHLFGLLFAWNRKFPRAFAAQTRHEWLSWHHSNVDTLAGKTMLIVGFGSIGERVARAAEAFGMKVVGVRRTPSKSDSRGLVQVEAFSMVPSLLPHADIVVNILPLTEDTRGAFGQNEFTLMKRTALFANIGRGGTVDEGDLIDALQNKRIAGAVLDVTAEEPLSPRSPLWDLENVIITSHYSGFHPRYDELAFNVFLDNLGRYVRGETLRNRVDKWIGY